MTDDREPHDQAVRDQVASDLVTRSSSRQVPAPARPRSSSIGCALSSSPASTCATSLRSPSPRRPPPSCACGCARSSRSGRRRRALQRSALLGDAPMSTLHAFARRLLTQHGLVVGVPPRFEAARRRSARPSISRSAGVRSPRAVRPRRHPRAGRATRQSSSGSRRPASASLVVALHESYDRLRDAPQKWEWPSSRRDLPPVDISPFLAAIPECRARPTRCWPSTSTGRAVADSDEARIDVLRTERVLPSRLKIWADAPRGAVGPSSTISAVR